MRVTVLGGSAACPNPGQGCSSYLVETSEQTLLLDCGPDTLLELRKHARLDDLDRIIISHVHSDHTLDLVPLRYGIKYDPGINHAAIPVLMPPGGLDFLERVANAFAMGEEPASDFFTVGLEPSEYDPESPLSIGGDRITFHSTNHPVPCWAVRLESVEGILVYLADTGPQEDLVHIARDADILICEGTFPDHAAVAEIRDRPHLSAFEAGEIARDAGARELILTHLWASADLRVYESEASRGFQAPVHSAHPGLSIEVNRDRGE